MLIHTNMHAYPHHTWMHKSNKNINYRAFLVEVCQQKRLQTASKCYGLILFQKYDVYK